MFQRWIVLFVLALLSISCGPQPGSGKVDVDFLWVKGASNGRDMEGGASHAILKVEKSTTGMHVGVFESKPGGTGETWRAAMWVAALTGTLQARKNPLDYRYSVETETLSARVDGPSAGGLFAVAVMAALNGHMILDDVTMTGTINPDGTIGPVGGVAEKLKASARMGKRRFCYPVGQRFEEQAGSGARVDLQVLADEMGIEGREVEDLNQAYYCLTGQRFGRISPVRRSEMALSTEAFDLLRRKTETWLARSQEAYSASAKFEVFKEFERFWTKTGNTYDDAQALLKEGLVAAAYRRAVEAYISSRSIFLWSAMVQQLSAGDPVKAIGVFTEVENATNGILGSVFASLSQVSPTTVGQTIAVLDAYEAAVTAVVSQQFARAQFADVRGKMEKALDKGAPPKEVMNLFWGLFKPLEEIAAVEVNAQMALDTVALMGLEKGGRKTSLLHLSDVATLFQGAASANVEYFDAIFVSEVAQKTGRTRESVSAVLLDKEQNYRTAQFNLKLPDSGKMGYATTGLPLDLAKLAGALSSFFASSVLVATFYSIGVKLGKDGEIVGVSREKALIATLSLAEEKARENAAQAKKVVGVIPEAAKVAYQVAMVLRERPTYTDKLAAVEHFWRSSVWSQVAVYLARLEKNLPH